MWPRISRCGIIVSGFLWLSTLGHAATLQVDGAGTLTGATGVDVGGTLYDVVFLDGSCTALFSGCDVVADFPFPTEADALAASQALLDQVFIGTFDALSFENPNLISGCVSDSECSALTPFALEPGTVGVILLSARAFNHTQESFDGVGVNESPTTLDTSPPSNTFMWASWTLSPSAPVPLPSTLGLLGAAGLVALLARRKR